MKVFVPFILIEQNTGEIVWKSCRSGCSTDTKSGEQELESNCRVDLKVRLGVKEAPTVIYWSENYRKI